MTGNAVSQQLMMFLRSIALGAALGLTYDLLGALRALGGKIWGALLDALYCLTAVASLFFFVLAGSGELRIFILAGALGGAVLFFCLLSRPLRPLWAFWLRILLTPASLAAGLLRKGGEFFKKHFLFARDWVTMEYKRRRGRKLPAPREGDEAMKKNAPGKNGQKKRSTQRKRPNSRLTALILLVLLIGISVQIVNLLGQLKTARAEEALYAQRLAALEATNSRLEEDIANRDSLDLIEDIAREELGLVTPGEKVFIFSK